MTRAALGAHGEPRPAALEDNERWRRILWSGHGHGPALYGDDGEMQCGWCGVDYKRSPFAEIVAAALNPPQLVIGEPQEGKR